VTAKYAKTQNSNWELTKLISAYSSYIKKHMGSKLLPKMTRKLFSWKNLSFWEKCC